MSYDIEKHLIEMGILPATTMDELEAQAVDLQISATMQRGYFDDPMDANGEVPF